MHSLGVIRSPGGIAPGRLPIGPVQRPLVVPIHTLSLPSVKGAQVRLQTPAPVTRAAAPPKTVGAGILAPVNPAGEQGGPIPTGEGLPIPPVRPPQVDAVPSVATSAGGGGSVDQAAQAPGLPDWLIPAGIGVVLFLLFKK